MDDPIHLSRRRLLKTLGASGVIAAADLAWWEEPFLTPRRAYGATPVRFQFSVPEPKRTALVESLAERFNKSQTEHEVKGEFEGMGAVEDLTGKVKDWKHYKDVLPLAWQTVTVKDRILSYPWVVTNDGLYWRTDRAKEYGVKPPRDDWN